MDRRFTSDRFPRSSQYHPDWVLAGVSGGANSLWLTEWLTEALDLRPGMRVLDLGCGRACRRSSCAGNSACRSGRPTCGSAPRRTSSASGTPASRMASFRFTPMRGRCRSPRNSSTPSSHRLVPVFRHRRPVPQLPRPLREAGRPDRDRRRRIDAGDRRSVPEHLRAWWTPDLWCLHSAGWWRRHWERTGIVDVEVADTLPDGWRRWLDWHGRSRPTTAPRSRRWRPTRTLPGLRSQRVPPPAGRIRPGADRLGSGRLQENPVPRRGTHGSGGVRDEPPQRRSGEGPQ